MFGQEEQSLFTPLAPKGQVPTLEEKAGKEQLFTPLAKKEEVPQIEPEPLEEVEEKAPSFFEKVKGLAGDIGERLITSAKHLGSMPKIMEEEAKKRLREIQEERAAVSPYKAPAMGVPSEALRERLEKEGRLEDIAMYKQARERKEEPSVVEGGLWSRDPKINELSNKLSYILPWWLTGFASPVFVATYEAVRQIPNIALALKEKSEYDPIAQRYLEELGSDEFWGGAAKALSSWAIDKPYRGIVSDPENLRTAARFGEEAIRLIVSGMASGKMTEAFRERNVNTAGRMMRSAGYSEAEIQQVMNDLRAIPLEDFQKEIENMLLLRRGKPIRPTIEPTLPGEQPIVPAVAAEEAIPRAPRRITPPVSRYATEKTVFPPGMTEAEKVAFAYEEATGRAAQETVINVKPQADGSIDVTVKRPVVAPEAPESAKELAMGAFFASREAHPRILYKQIVNSEAVKEGIVTPDELVKYVESRGKEVVDKPVTKPPKKTAALIGFQDPLWQAIADRGGVAPDRDFSRNYLIKDLGIPSRIVRKSGMKMDELSASLSEEMPRIEDSRDLERILLEKKGAPKTPTKKAEREELERRAEEEYEKFKEEEIAGFPPGMEPTTEQVAEQKAIHEKAGKAFQESMDKKYAELTGKKPYIKDGKILGEFWRDPDKEVPQKVLDAAPSYDEFMRIFNKHKDDPEFMKFFRKIKDEDNFSNLIKTWPAKESYGKWMEKARESRSKGYLKQLELFSEQKPEESAELFREEPILREIEKAISEGKDLTETQKGYLEKQGLYEFGPEADVTERVVLPEVKSEAPVKGARVKLARVSIETPTGSMYDMGYVTEDFLDRVTDYAKDLGLQSKVRVMERREGTWPYGSHFAPLEQAKYMQGIIKDVKKVPKKQWQEWEKYSGYPFTKEVRDAIDRIKSKRGLKRRVEIEELRAELQKTDKGKVEWMFIETELKLKDKRKPSFNRAYKAAKRAIVDTSGNVKKDLLKDLGVLGKEAVMDHDLAAGASSKAERLYEKASKSIYKGLSKDEEQLLNRAIYLRRQIAISKYRTEVTPETEAELMEEPAEGEKFIKHPHGLTAREHEEYLKDIPEEINKLADLYFKEMEKVLDQLLEEGLINDTTHDSLKSKGDYSPRVFIQHIDPERTYSISGKLITVPSSGLKALDEGSYQVMETDSRKLLSQVISRTQNVIFRNRANVSAYELAEQIPENGIFRLAKVSKTTKEGKPVYAKAPAGWAKIKAMVDGEPQEFMVIDKYAKEWLTRDPLIDEQLVNIIGWLSGSKILKPMATGLNPGFAVTNLPRDIAHIWITTSEYSSFMPKFILQMSRDLLATVGDAMARKGRWIDYLDEGGGMYFLTHQGKTIKTRNPALRKLQDVLSYVGETSEIWTRIALRERALRQGKSPKEATWTARNYLDFSQGGNVSKALDAGIPYLNAGIQGTRGIFRALGDRPADTLWKFAQLGALAAGLYLANHYAHRKNYARVPDREKVNNFVIMTPYKVTDKNGNERCLYFKIAKDQGQRIVCTIFENLMKKYLGEPVDGDQIGQAIQEFIPIIPSQNLPPSIDAMLGYFANKDFWRNEDIWKGPKVTPREEYTVYTHPGLVELGKKTGLSPERIKYVLQQFFTYGNVYTSLVGAGLNSVIEGQPEKDKRKIKAEVVTNLPIVRRFAKLTPPYSEEQLKKVEKAATEESTRRYKQRRELQEMSNEFYRKLKDEKVTDKDLLKKIKVFIKEQPKEDQDRLYQWFRKYELVYDIPDKSWWLDLTDMPPEARATVFWTKYMESDKDERKDLVQLAKRIPGVWSDRFYKRFKILLKKSREE